MGGGNWSANTYSRNTQQKVNSGTNFGYSRQTQSQSRSNWKAHEELDPKKVAGSGSPLAGQIVRESRDSVDHPNSVPISVIFDETGSMGEDAKRVQKKLATLFGLLLRKGYVEDPQILIGAYGDALSDRVPLQVSQFESDNRVDDALDKLFIEGNGGGNGGESQALAWYYLTHHIATDAMDKRNKKGYAFLIADEISHQITADQVRQHIGDGEPLGDITLPGLAKAFKEKWDVYILVLNNLSAQAQNSISFYKRLFGEEHVLVLESAESVAETIGIVLGVAEGNVDIDDAADDLADEGSSAVAIRGAVKATSNLARLAKPSAVGTVDVKGGSGASRL
jgi:hypothetical protein